MRGLLKFQLFIDDQFQLGLFLVNFVLDWGIQRNGVAEVPKDDGDLIDDPNLFGFSLGVQLRLEFMQVVGLQVEEHLLLGAYL
jgi:hypothetical protein